MFLQMYMNTLITKLRRKNNLEMYCSQFVIFALRENCPNTEYFLVCIFPHSDWIRRDTSYFSVFSPNAGKYGTEKAPYLDTFHAVLIYLKTSKLVTVLLQFFKILAKDYFVENYKLLFYERTIPSKRNQTNQLDIDCSSFVIFDLVETY